MPIYEYRCRSRGSQFERIQKFADPPVAECPSCGGEVEKLVSSPAFQFKGSGWYVTDYARKADAAGKDGKAEGADAKSGESGDSAKPETKPETKTEKTADKAKDSTTKPASTTT